MRKVLIFLFAFIIVGCGEQESAPRTELISELYHADPKHDAAQAIANGDFQFIAVHNHHLIMPMNIDDCVLDKFGYRVISNEPLQYMGYEFQMYGAMSVIYANWYNFEILSKLEVLEEYPCNNAE